MSGAIPPLSQYNFMAWFPVKAQGQLYLLPLIENTSTADMIFTASSVLKLLRCQAERR
jgi:hypothetical protein